MVKNCCLVAALCTLVAACHTPPPRGWLRYELDGVTEWAPQGAGSFAGNLLGSTVTIDLFTTRTRVLVVVENPTDAAVVYRVGPEAGAPRAAIGEVLLRRVGDEAAGGPDMQAYNAMQPLIVEPGWRATFYLDTPLGREPKLGQYFVLSIEAENAAGERLRRSLPMVAKMGGTVPASLR